MRNPLAEQSRHILQDAVRIHPAFAAHLVEQIPCVFWATNTELRITACIGSGMKSIHRETEDLVGKTIGELLDLTNQQHLACLEAHRRALLGESCGYDIKYESRFQRAHVEALLGPDGEVIGTIGMAFDETEGKRAQDCLQASFTITRVIAEAQKTEEVIAQVLHTLCECLGWQWGAFWTIDQPTQLRCMDYWHRPEMDLTELEAATQNFVATPENSLPGRAVAADQPLWVKDLARFKSVRAPIAQRAGFHAAIVFPVRRGTVIVGAMEFLTRELTEPDDTVLGLLAAVGCQLGHLLERCSARDACWAAANQFRQLVEFSPDATFIIEHDRIVLANQPCLNLVGAQSAAQVLGRPPLDLFHHDCHALVRERLQINMPSPIPLVEGKVVRIDGTTTDVEISVCPFVEQGRKAIQVVCRGIADRKKLAAQLQVAHDFNNLITIISGYSELLLGSPNLDLSSKKLLKEIRIAGDRAAALTRQLLAGRHRKTVEPDGFDLNGIDSDQDASPPHR